MPPEAESPTLGNSGRLKTLVPVVPDAPIGNFRFHPLRWLPGLPLKHSRPLQRSDRLHRRIHGTE